MISNQLLVLTDLGGNVGEAGGRRQEGQQGFRVELVITEVRRGVDRLEWLRINVHFLLSSLLSNDGAAADYLTVGRHFAVELESVLDRGDDPVHRGPVHQGLDAGPLQGGGGDQAEEGHSQGVRKQSFFVFDVRWI